MSRPDANSVCPGNLNNNVNAMQQYQMASMQYYATDIATYANSGTTDAWNYSNYGYGSSAVPANQYSGTVQAQSGSTLGNQGNNGGVSVTSQQQYYNMPTPVQYPQRMNYSCPPPPPPPPPPQEPNSVKKSASCTPAVPQQPLGGLLPMHQPPPGCPTSQSQPHATTLPPPPPPPPPVAEPITISCPPMPPTFPWITPAMFAPLSAFDHNSYTEHTSSTSHSNRGIDHSTKKNFPKYEDQQTTKPSHLKWTDPIDPTIPQVLKDMFQPLFCKLCNLSLSSAIVASDHYKGKRHKKCIEVWLTENPDAPRRKSKIQVDESRNLQNSPAPTKRNHLDSETSRSSFDQFKTVSSKNDSLPKNFSRNTFGQENHFNDFRSHDKRGVDKFSDNQSNNPNGATQWNRNDEWDRNSEGFLCNSNNFVGNERNFTGQPMLNGESSVAHIRGGKKNWNSNNSQTSYRSASPVSDSGSSSRFGGNNRNKSAWQKRNGDGWLNQSENSVNQPLPLMCVDTADQRENVSRFPPGNGGFRGKANLQGGNDSRKSFQGNTPFQGKGRSFQNKEPSFQDKGPPFQQNFKRSGANSNQAPPTKKEKSDYKGSTKCEICNIVLNSKSSAEQHFAGKKHRDNLLNHQKTGQFDHMDRSFGIGTSFRENKDCAGVSQSTPSKDSMDDENTKS